MKIEGAAVEKEVAMSGTTATIEMAAAASND